MVRPLRRRAEPEIVIESIGQRLRIAGARVLGRPCLPCMNARDLSEVAGLDDLHDSAVVGKVVVNMVPHLGDALVVP